MKRAIKYLHGAQFAHGDWISSCGVCSTYGTWLALQGLALVGEYYHNSARVRKACHFLLANQKDDGGWGESSKVYIVPLIVILLLLIASPSVLPRGGIRTTPTYKHGSDFVVCDGPDARTVSY